MKKGPGLFIASMLIVGGIALNAQDESPPDKKGEPSSRKHSRGRGARMDMTSLKAELKLSDEQCDKLKPVLEKIKGIFEAARPQRKRGADSDSGQKRPSREEMKKKMQEMRENILAALEPAKEFLSDEQYKKLQEKFSRSPGGRRGKRSGRNNSGDSKE